MAPENSEPNPSNSVHQPVVLLVDDEALVLMLMMPVLQAQGYVVLSASDGQKALELSRSYNGKIDLVITDAVMPRLNGIQLCEHLLRERPGIKVILMSGGETEKVVRQNANLSFLQKPFDRETLLARIRTVLGNP